MNDNNNNNNNTNSIHKYIHSPYLYNDLSLFG